MKLTSFLLQCLSQVLDHFSLKLDGKNIAHLFFTMFAFSFDDLNIFFPRAML
jgi:hypothetical protein